MNVKRLKDFEPITKPDSCLVIANPNPTTGAEFLFCKVMSQAERDIAFSALSNCCDMLTSYNPTSDMALVDADKARIA